MANHLNSYQIHQIMQRFPDVELSYETIPHKKVSKDYNVCIAIPVGKKAYLWYTFYGEKDVCFLIELNREKKPVRMSILSYAIPMELAKGTILYGTIIENDTIEKKEIQETKNLFLIDDVLFYSGNPTRGLYFSERLGIMYDFFKSAYNKISLIFDDSVMDKQYMIVALPMIWGIKHEEDYDCIYELPQKWYVNPPYTTHHVQFRCLNKNSPYFNVIPTRKALPIPSSMLNTNSNMNIEMNAMVFLQSCEVHNRMDYSKTQYQFPTIFIVMADIQFDVYHLFAYGRNKQMVYCGVAGVPTLKTSIFLNSIFRNIRENQNLDAIEESDDEEEFENVNYNKWVNLNKKMQIECRFHSKFKRWVPTRKLDGSNKIVHVSHL